MPIKRPRYIFNIGKTKLYAKDKEEMENTLYSNKLDGIKYFITVEFMTNTEFNLIEDLI